jgi:hypothetical protein
MCRKVSSWTLAIVLIALTIVFLATMSTPAVAAKASGNFSFSFKIEGHVVIVSGLANGKSFLKIDGKLFTPQAGSIQAKAGTTTVTVMNAGKSVYIGDEELSISQMVEKPKIKDKTTVLIGNKIAFRSKGGYEVGDPPMWNFDYYFSVGKRTFDMLAVLSSKHPTPHFIGLVKTLRVREAQIR